MKKIVSLLVVLVLLMSAAVAMAAGMGVQIIGGNETEAEPVSLDDIQLNADADISGWGVFTATAYEVQDGLGYFGAGKTSLSGYGHNYYDYYWSGAEADYACLYVDIINTRTVDVNFLANVEVKVVYDDCYEYAGWFYQRNYNNEHDSYCYKIEADKDKQNKRFVINAADQFVIGPMYKGHYIFGCTLPNAVLNSKSPLRMEITIDGNEITYNIRK